MLNILTRRSNMGTTERYVGFRSAMVIVAVELVSLFINQCKVAGIKRYARTREKN